MSDTKPIDGHAAGAGAYTPAAGARDPVPLPRGSCVGAYAIEAILGSGGFGITYCVRHQGLNKLFALKEYFPSQFSYREHTTVQPTATSGKEYAWGMDRFMKEARALAKFKHPAILEVSDIFAANNTAYMVLAYEEAPSLDKWLAALARRATQNELDRIVVPLLEALELIHSHAMLHRDIAPDNILVRSDGTPVLIDFGAARDDLRHRIGRVTAVIKPGYAPPEQYEGTASRQGPWSDIYGFGATLYYAVVGSLPVQMEDEFDPRVRTLAVKRAGGFYRQGFLKAIDWAMEHEPTARPQTVAQWRLRLLGADEDENAHIGDTRPLMPPDSLPPNRSRAICGIAIAVVLAALAMPAWLWSCSLLGIACPGVSKSGTGSAPVQIEIAMPARTFAVGDNLNFSLRSNRDCHFLVYTIGPAGEVERHDPEENAVFMGSPVLKAGEWRRIPVKGFATVKPPSGNFELGAVCSEVPLADVGLSEAQLREPARSGRRSFSFALDNAGKVAKRDELARAVVGYEVRP